MSRSLGFFFLAVLLVGLSGIAAADDALGLSASGSVGAAAIAAPGIVPVLDNSSSSGNGSVSANASAAVPADGKGPHPRPGRALQAKEIRGRAQQIRDDAKVRNEAINEHARLIRDDVKVRVEQIQDAQQKRMNQTREQIQGIRRMGKQRLEQLRQERQANLDRARDLEANLTAKVNALRAKGRLNDTEKAELKNQANLALKAAFDRRVELAKRLEADGANATLVADFAAFAQADWDRYANATNASAKKEFILQFNQRWAQFRKAVVQGVMVAKLQVALNESRQALTRLDAVIARLSAAGFNTAGLPNESASITVRLDAVLSAQDLPVAVMRLRQARDALAHLRNAIERTVNHELVESFRETAVPSVTADASLSIAGGSPNASGSDDLGAAGASTPDTAAGATASPSTPPTNGDGGASASGSSPANASAGSGSA